MATPTADEIAATLNEYADWSELGSLSRAKTWETAAVRFLALVPGSASDSGSAHAFNASILQAELDRCRRFISASSSRRPARRLQTRDWRK